jgi:SH3 domain-containing YSC84-like protein 1
MSMNFLPSSLDKECKKAAATLKSFCGMHSAQKSHRGSKLMSITEEGVEIHAESPKGDEKTNGKKTTAKIPRSVIANAIGLVVFSQARIGMHLSGATGSGIIIARLPNGTWSPPAAISVLGLSAGIGMGVIVYDCVCVINTKEGMDSFTQKQVNMGSQVSLAAGPWGASAQGDKAKEGEETKPVYTYTKTKGFFAGVSVDGTRIGMRDDANAKFYGEKVEVQKILKGEVSKREGEKVFPAGAEVLAQALKSIE